VKTESADGIKKKRGKVRLTELVIISSNTSADPGTTMIRRELKKKVRKDMCK
jgi:hypothetical protein